ncbi:MAG TPA: potassium transporter TrkG [Nitrososphaera sp.]|jgi:trk system potassium uptake protein TrkH
MQDPLERPATAYMHREFVLLDENVNVAHAVGEMQARHAETIIVTRSGVPVGIVTDSDILDKVVMKGEDSDNVYLKSIMTSPIITLSSRGNVEQALQLMRINQVKRIPITDNVSIIGMVTQRALADAVRNAVLETTFRNYRAAIREHYKPILGNLGFTLQFAGILMIAPTYLGTALGENVSATGIFLAAVHLLGAGFILNAYGEKRPLNVKQASILVISSFLVLSLFGSIPYIYVNPFRAGIDPLSLFVNSFFESASGFTTTGLSMITHPENLTETMVFYRSYTQWVGGLSFIYLIMTLFYPERKLSAMKSVLGGGMLRFKQLLVTVGVIFSAYTVGLVLFLVLVGQTPDIYAVSIIFSSVTGGGFVPASDILATGQPQVLSALIAGMVISALPFAFHYSIFSKQARTKRLTSEVITYGIIMTASIPLFTFLAGASLGTGSSWFSSIFHIVSASTNSGFQYIDARALALDAKILLIVLMFIGGTAFSTAGGIKVARVLILFQRLFKKGVTTDTPSSISILSKPHERSLTRSEPRNRKEQQQQRQEDNNNAVAADKGDGEPSADHIRDPSPKRMSLFSDRLLRESAIVILSFITLAVATGLVVAYLSGSSIENGIFEAVSALTTTGLSAGITSMDLDLFSKLLLAANMIVGRFEIIAVLYIFFEALRR